MNAGNVKDIPQWLKPSRFWGTYVRAEARTLHEVPIYWTDSEWWVAVLPIPGIDAIDTVEWSSKFGFLRL